jgi:hypothetical protein
MILTLFNLLYLQTSVFVTEKWAIASRFEKSAKLYIAELKEVGFCYLSKGLI